MTRPALARAMPIPSLLPPLIAWLFPLCAGLQGAAIGSPAREASPQGAPRGSVSAGPARGRSLGTPQSAATPATDLARARARFAEGDLDKSGGLEPEEAEALGFSAYQARRFDHDGDGKLALEEFLVGDRRRAAERGLRVELSFEAEVTRIMLRRAVERREPLGAGAASAEPKSAESSAGATSAGATREGSAGGPAAQRLRLLRRGVAAPASPAPKSEHEEGRSRRVRQERPVRKP